MFKKVLGLVVLLAFGIWSGLTTAATLLPNGEQVFLDNDGNPLADGRVYFYIPNTTTPKDTYQNSGATVLNANPIVLDSAGRAIIYGSGSYRQVLKDADGNEIWDQLTGDGSASTGTVSWGGTSTGTANVQVIATIGFSSTDGQIVAFIAGFTNTASMTLQPTGAAAIPMRKDLTVGSTLLTGGEVVAGSVVMAIYDATIGAFHMISFPPAYPQTLTNLLSATTTSLGTIPSHNVNITSTNTITSFGSAAATDSPIYNLTFAGALTLTYNATSLILPGGMNITTAAGDTAVAMYLGSGNWRVVSYTAVNRVPGNQVIAGNFRNLVTTATSNTAVTITADAITLETTAGTSAIRRSTVSVACDITVSGAGGLDTGAEASNTWYSTWVIFNPATTTNNCLLSTSATAPTLPSGYTYQVRTGWVRNDGSSNLYRTLQAGAFVTYIVGTNPVATPLAANGVAGTMSDASPTLASVSLASWVPPTARAAYMTAFTKWKDGVEGTLIVAPNTSWGGTNRGPLGSVGNIYPFASTSSTARVSSAIRLALETIAFAWASNSTGAAIGVLGWEDNL